ncbi:MAG: hypothetical protein ACRYFX_03625 [Janthinobacterium lividum]
MFSSIQAHRNLLPLGLLLLACGYTFWSARPGPTEHLVLSVAHYVGVGLVGLTVLLYFSYRSFFAYALLLTLLLGLFNLANFTPDEYRVALGFGDLRLAVQPFVGLLLLVYYALNSQAINGFIRHYVVPPASPARQAQYHREEIDQFKSTFSKKSTESLGQLVEQNKLVPAAITAAQEIIAERKQAV